LHSFIENLTCNNAFHDKALEKSASSGLCFCLDMIGIFSTVISDPTSAIEPIARALWTPKNVAIEDQIAPSN